MVKCTECSCRGPRFSSQHLHGGSGPSVTQVPRVLKPSLLTFQGSRHMHGAHKLCMENTHTHGSAFWRRNKHTSCSVSRRKVYLGSPFLSTLPVILCYRCFGVRSEGARALVVKVGKKEEGLSNWDPNISILQGISFRTYIFMISSFAYISPYPICTAAGTKPFT